MHVTCLSEEGIDTKLIFYVGTRGYVNINNDNKEKLVKAYSVMERNNEERKHELGH